MEFFNVKNDIPFMRSARMTILVSAAFFVAAVVALAVRGLNFSIDFTGGTVIELHYTQPADIPSIRSTLEQKGFGAGTVQSFGAAQDVMIRIPVQAGKTSAQLSEDVLTALREKDATVERRRTEFVGPQVGQELVEDGGLALLLVSFGIMAYLALRFEWRFAVGGIIATVHDVIIVLGFFALFQWEFSLTVLAALLAILGYSVNDTVVVFDRIRENFRKMRKGSVGEIIDSAMTRTLSRTIMTSTTTSLMVLAMLFLGGEVLFYFALALIIGIAIGTYSSVLVASPIVMWLGISRENMMPVKKEGAGVDSMP